MEVKKLSYEKAEVEVIVLNENDVITMSSIDDSFME